MGQFWNKVKKSDGIAKCICPSVDTCPFGAVSWLRGASSADVATESLKVTKTISQQDNGKVAPKNERNTLVESLDVALKLVIKPLARQPHDAPTRLHESRFTPPSHNSSKT